ncbi:DUF448 domain-containing protein [Paremcibacter congregatus]|jgi:predicted RNA-binding protein YlxR (DUF448 family)/ribosomal protein L7Ae-like RNA K-turn-binding protein|uniref:DUF448 domain-containing protein n=1 Tax=Paremcibacter congregatus TaxID=2043170 RepID=UPI0030EE8586
MVKNRPSPRKSVSPDERGPKKRALKSRVPKNRERKCLVTGESHPVQKLIRFVLDPEGNVTPDVAAKLPGRGGWILADRAVLESAMKKKIFVRFGHRALSASSRKAADVETLDDEDVTDDKKDVKRTVRVDENLPDIVEQLLRQRCLNYLGLVNRAGLLITGFEKVRAKLQAGKCRALITADDAADNGRSKLCSGLGNVLDKLRVIDMFTREELGQTLGLSNAVHVALLPGGMTESFLAEFSRYEDIAMR